MTAGAWRVSGSPGTAVRPQSSVPKPAHRVRTRRPPFRRQSRGLDPPQPAYQGRPLPRTENEAVDQGLGFDVETLLDRRRALRFLGFGAAGAVLTVCSKGAPMTLEPVIADLAMGGSPFAGVAV